MKAERLANLIRERRELAGLSQKDLSDALRSRGLHYSERGVSKWESGEALSIPPDVANALAKIMSIRVREICEAMGYALEDAVLTQTQSSLVSIEEQIPERLKPAFLALCRGAMRGVFLIEDTQR